MDQNAFSYNPVKARNKYVAKVFSWMGIGLVVSAITAAYAISSLDVFYRIHEMRMFLMIGELVLVMALGAMITKISAVTASVMFIFYSALNGLTLSYVFVFYDIGSITMAFVSTAILFGLFAVIGFTTSKDLTKLANIAVIGLVATILISVVNMIFFKVSGIELVMSVVSLIAFVGLTAYDMQKIKQYQLTFGDNHNIAVYAALSLYLDVIGIFLNLLRIFGRDR